MVAIRVVLTVLCSLLVAQHRTVGAVSLGMSLTEGLDGVEERLGILRTATSGHCGSVNQFGDNQLEVDVEADNLIFARLKASGAVSVASSEEQPELVQLQQGPGFGVSFDPLDGSSVLSANFAVGSIFGVWPDGVMLGRPGREQAAAVYAVYGPQTLLVVARPRSSPAAASEAAAPASTCGTDEAPSTAAVPLSTTHMVQEYLLQPDNQWRLRRPDVRLQDSSSAGGKTCSVFAPANLRAAADNKVYAALVDAWVAERFTLRYTGGMVPDVHHILAKGGGVFCNAASPSSPPKLRLLYECAPLAFVIEAAGGASHDAHGSALDTRVVTCCDRHMICLGDPALVRQSVPALQAGLSKPSPSS